MITVYIYLEHETSAEHLAAKLLTERLVAHVGIDRDNISLVCKEGKVQKEIHYVITAQTRALLFNRITEFVEQHSGESARIYAQPITQCNQEFYKHIQENTLQIEPITPRT